MRPLKTLLVCVIVLCFALANSRVWGQTEGLKYRLTRWAVLEHLEKYNKLLDREGKNVNEFQKLFTDSNALIANDILMQNMLDSALTLREYENQREVYYNHYHLDQEAMIIEKLGALNYTNNENGYVDVLVTRYIKWVKKRGVEDDFLFRDTLSQVFRINFEQSTSDVNCKIASIKNTTPLGKHLLLRAAYKRNKRETWIKNDTLMVNGLAMTTDLNGYVQIKRLKATQEISVQTLNPDYPQTLKRSPSSLLTTEQYAKIRFRMPKWHVELQSGLMPVGYRNIQSDEYTSRSQHDYLVGLNFGRSIKKTEKWDWLVKAIINQSWHESALSTPVIQYSYLAVDPDNFTYERQITISDFSEQLNMTITAIGLGLSASYKLSQRNALQAEFGYQHVANQNATSSRTANGLFGGFYSELFGVSIFENGIYDFGSFELAESNVAMNTRISRLYVFQLRISTMLSRTSSIQYGLLYRQSTIGVENAAQQLRLSSAPNQLNSLLQTSEAGMLRFINFTLGYQYKF